MATLVADTSALVSLGTVSEPNRSPLSHCLDGYEVLVPEAVVAELEAIASYDDAHGRAASVVLERHTEYATQAVVLDTDFPLDDGENAAVTLANTEEAELLLCDEFTRLGLIHASLRNTRLVTTPTLLSVLVRKGRLTTEDARTVLDEISAARSWEANSYVQRARSLLDPA